MRDHQVSGLHLLVPEQEDVDVDDTRPPSPRWPASPFPLDRFGRVQQLTRGTAPFAFDDLVEESWLLGHAPWFGFDDAALPQNPHAFLAQSPPRRAEVACAGAEV